MALPQPKSIASGTAASLALTAAQQTALAALDAFVQGTEKLYLLTGYAGTGKTTLLQVFINGLRDRGDDRPIVLSAFSNKATKVLAAMAAQWRLDIDAMTCCKLLGLRPVINEDDGNQMFVIDRQQASQIDRYRLVIVDECSMVNQELWELLVNAVSNLYRGTQILFVGDPAQLPPVNEPESACFRQIIHKSQLTEVVRYGGAIAVIAEDIRRHLERDSLPRFTSDINAGKTEGCFVLPGPAWHDLLIRAFTSPAYQQNPDQVRALAYTNRRVAQLNQLIRTAIYGSQAQRFVPGERLIAVTPCLEEDTIVLPTSAECEVLHMVRGREGEWPLWMLEVETETGDYKTLRVLHESGQAEFKAKLDFLAKEKRWMEFWDLQQRFHAVDYAYSLTIHKSQGSTFQDVFVDVPSMMANRNVIERNQLCYVAFTRAAKRLFLYQ
ncbi:AAA family ATPase [Nodosilinea sp. LEGE 07298]|uniref:ATP-dependent DNA helicase n=1 Tax=Nodosilinea sp. LEGE 07298 TaxID=2777970 RepID=UPI00187E2E41|nr:AAA family ATPase [Nodosilinea sp. LEGE 07298]MBE9112882.1 AAA family ATPase [Nodosilinea sp. LEGE 07298]